MNILLEKSLINTHCRELDSIVVKDAPGMVRMFIARRHHELWRNDPSQALAFSVALHKHHCDVTLMPVFGTIYNVLGGTHGDSVVLLKPYRYKSPILAEESGGFAALDNTFMPISLVKNEFSTPVFMRSVTAHTIYVPRYKEAAWWVWEGMEDPNYSPIVWSNDSLETFDFGELNRPMTEERLQEDLALIGVRHA